MEEYVEPRTLEEARDRLRIAETEISRIASQIQSKNWMKGKRGTKEYQRWRSRAGAARHHYRNAAERLRYWIVMHDPEQIQERLLLQAARMRDAEDRDARKRLYRAQLDLDPDDPDSLVIASFQLLQRLRREEKLLFYDDEEKFMELLRFYVTERAKALITS